METNIAPRKILTAQEVRNLTGYSRVQLWRKSRDPDDTFPIPMRVGANRIGWWADEIANWQASLPRVSWAIRSSQAA